ncbi:MAG: hypothetical protein ACK4NF_06940, partial [Planctomycetota bacterium]
MLEKKFKSLFSLLLFFVFILSFSSCKTHLEVRKNPEKSSLSEGSEVIVPADSLKKVPPTLKKLYTNNNIVNLTDFKCYEEFCTLYVVKNKRVIQTRLIVNKEPVIIKLEKEGSYYLKLTKRDVLPPKRLKEFDYKVIYDLSPPLILIKTSQLHKTIQRGNVAIKMCYQSFDRNPYSVNVWYYDSYKKAGTILSSQLPPKGCFNFLLPSYSTTLDFYFKAKDKANNFSPPEKITIYVDAEPPTLTFTIPQITNSDKISIAYTAFDRGMAGLDFVEVYIKSPSKDFEKVGTYHDFKKTIDYQLDREGFYKFVLKAYDKVGNIFQSEEKLLVKDDTPPRISVEGFTKELYYADELVRLKITVEEEHPDDTINLFLSDNLGKQWKKIEFNTTGEIIEFKIPALQTQNALLRIETKDRAQNVGAWESHIFS